MLDDENLFKPWSHLMASSSSGQDIEDTTASQRRKAIIEVSIYKHKTWYFFIYFSLARTEAFSSYDMPKQSHSGEIARYPELWKRTSIKQAKMAVIYRCDVGLSTRR